MTQRSHPNPRSLRFAMARPRHQGWRAAARQELQLIRVWFRSGMSRGLDWLLQIGVPTAATVLEMQNVKRRIPEIAEIDEAVQSASTRARARHPVTRAPGGSPVEH
jgi:hypothetical protein